MAPFSFSGSGGDALAVGEVEAMSLDGVTDGVFALELEAEPETDLV